MGIHMNLDYHEPPRGDFVALIEHMVGSPPDDPEMAAKELSARLEARARRNKELSQLGADTMYGDDPNGQLTSQPLSSLPPDGPPDVGDALRSLAGNSVRGFFNGASKLLIFAGVIIVAATTFLDFNLPVVEPLHGMGALIAGIFLNNATS